MHELKMPSGYEVEAARDAVIKTCIRTFRMTVDAALRHARCYGPRGIVACAATYAARYGKE